MRAISSREAKDVLWLAESRLPEQIAATGLLVCLQRNRPLLALMREQTDTRALAEEGLRAGAVAPVVMGLIAPIRLVAGFRLQLTAQAGQTIRLCLIPMGTPVS